MLTRASREPALPRSRRDERAAETREALARTESDGWGRARVLVAATGLGAQEPQGSPPTDEGAARPPGPSSESNPSPGGQCQGWGRCSPLGGAGEGGAAGLAPAAAGARRGSRSVLAAHRRTLAAEAAAPPAAKPPPPPPEPCPPAWPSGGGALRRRRLSAATVTGYMGVGAGGASVFRVSPCLTHSLSPCGAPAKDHRPIAAARAGGSSPRRTRPSQRSTRIGLPQVPRRARPAASESHSLGPAAPRGPPP